MKKIVSIILVAMMFVTLLPVSIFADDVVEIDSVEKFMAIDDSEDALKGNYKLTKDITVTEGLSWTHEDLRFSGTFDGNGHTITVDIKDTARARSALFCTVDSCTIKNLTVVGSVWSNGNSTAGLIGTVKGDGTVTITDVTVDVDVFEDTADNGQGGFVGAIEDSATVKITNCTNKGDVSGRRAGGFVGCANGNTTVEITNSVNEGTITGTYVKWADRRGAGGFVGVAQENSHVRLTDCTNKGNVSTAATNGNAYVGDIHINNAKDTNRYSVTNCKNEGKIVSGGYELPAAQATGYCNSFFGWGEIKYDVATQVISGAPYFDAGFDCTDFKAYVNGVDVTAKTTVEDKGDRKYEFSADATGLIAEDGLVAITFVWKDGTYATFGTYGYAPILSQLTKLEYKADTLAVENPLLQDNRTEAHPGYANLVDGDRNNKTEGWKTVGTSVIYTFQTTEAKIVTHYSIGTGGDDANEPMRQPTEWKLYGSADGTNYVVIDHVTNGNPVNENNTPVVYTTDVAETAYSYFKLELISFAWEAGRTDGDSYVQFGEVELYTCEHTYGEPVVDAGNCTKDTTTTKTCTVCGHEDVKVDKAPGHNYVDGECSVCGADETKPAPTGDGLTVLIALSAIAMAAIALVVSKKRAHQN